MRQNRPNIIIVLTDDQGFGDLSCHGNPVLKTPNLDRLHDESVRFSQFFVSPTCAPTRASLMTGKHEFRSGVTHTIFERERLSLKSTTLPQTLKSVGYTTGIFGKWHLGDEDAYLPERRGFDEVFIHGAGGIGQSYPGSCGDVPFNTYFDPTLWHNGKLEKTKGYCTDVFFTQALRWIEQVKGKQPFFAYITPNAPHAPLQVRPEDEARYAGKGLTADEAKFFGMVANIDDNVGRLREQLKIWGIERETLIVFMNDNGGTAGTKVFNAGMRTGKGTPYEGGTRATSLWCWPGQLAPGESAALAAHLDILPTLAELTGAKPPANLDGRSLLPLLKNPSAPWADRTLVTHVGRWERGRAAASKHAGCSIRSPRFRLVNNREFYDLKADPGEKINVIGQFPQEVAELRRTYDRWWSEVLPCLENENAPLPVDNPFWKRYQKQLKADDSALSLAPVSEYGGLPRVLLIGDSISMGYTLPVRRLLTGKAIVQHPPENCSDTANGLKKLDSWLGRGKWAAIHFNFGLHDLKYLNEKRQLSIKDGKQVATLEEYEARLRELVARLKKTGAALVWCATTPVPEGSGGRVQGDEVRYNAVAEKVMKEQGIPIHDLHTFAQERLAQIQRPKNVHFTPAGYQALAERVAGELEQALATRR